jgi:hypothetical protein
MTGGRGAASTESGDPVVRLMTGYHRSVWWWMSVTCGALAVAVALAVLIAGTSAPASVQLTGSVPGTGAARSYDIIVSAPGSGRAGDAGGWTANPAALDGLSGGIPFPAMSIYDNVVAGLKLTGVRVSRGQRDSVVEECLTKAGLWMEVRNRLRQPGGALSGGQQQRLCIARSLAVRPRVLLMDEPCSALDPTSTRVIEETMTDLVREVTIVIVTHNMQQAQRVSRRCAFFLAAQGEPGHIVEHGPAEAMFGSPQDPRTADYVHGRFG